MSAAHGGAPFIPVSWGELFDKLTILQIKRERLTSAAQLANVTRELDLLAEVTREVARAPELEPLLTDLRAVNEALWQIEDDIRDHERRRDFGTEFVALARSVYHRNDVRADLKRRISRLLGSSLFEEKSYQAY